MVVHIYLYVYHTQILNKIKCQPNQVSNLQEHGGDASIQAIVNAIGECLREPVGPRACLNIK